MDSARVRAEVREQCHERERLLREWTHRGRQLASVLDALLAALKNTDQNFRNFDEEIALAKRAENEACIAYYDHVDGHDYV